MHLTLLVLSPEPGDRRKTIGQNPMKPEVLEVTPESAADIQGRRGTSEGFRCVNESVCRLLSEVFVVLRASSATPGEGGRLSDL